MNPDHIPQLSRTEWADIAQALVLAGEKRRNVRQSGWFGRLRRCTDRSDCPAATRSGEDRIEAVQQFVEETRRRGGAPGPAALSLIEHGFSAAQIDALTLLAS